MARLGGPIVLIVLGLIAALAVQDRISGVDLGLIGWIVAGAGLLWLLLEMLLHRPRAQVTHETTSVQGSAPGTDRVVDREVRHDRA